MSSHFSPKITSLLFMKSNHELFKASSGQSHTAQSNPNYSSIIITSLRAFRREGSSSGQYNYVRREKNDTDWGAEGPLRKGDALKKMKNDEEQ